MAYKNTIARNHLSNESTLASKGRGGDTEIARTSKGELWHVNPQEKSLMSMYGMEGEKMVEAIGSGTINPQTGLREQDPVTTGIAIGSAALGAIASGTAGAERERQAKYTRKSAEQGLTLLAQQEGRLDPTKAAKTAVHLQDYRLGTESVSSETGVAIEDIDRETEQAIQRSGLATSGTVQRKKSDLWGRVQSMFGQGRKGLIAKLGKSMGDVEKWYEGEKSRILAERQKFENQRDLAKEQEEAWYLGKNIKKWTS